jgi:UPF0271 protein
MGEGVGNEAAIMPFITSANIACGFHAGDLDTMRQTIALCLQHGVHVGAHPSYADRQNFGRIDLMEKGLGLEDVYYMVADQLQLVKNACIEMGATLHHVKPHGALYNRAAWDEAVAKQVCKAIADFAGDLLVFGLSGSKMAGVAERFGLSFYHEVFADRTYQDDGSLTPRSQPNAMVVNEDVCIKQVQQMAQEQTVTTVTGKIIPLRADTLCIHGDGPHAVSFAKALHRLFMQRH